MDNNQTAKLIIETIPILRGKGKRPDRSSIAKFLASKHGLSESMVIDTVATLLTDAVIYNKPNKRGGESLYVSKMSAEAVSIIKADEEEEEGLDKTRPQQTQNKSGKKQNQDLTNDLPSMEDPGVIPIDTTWSIGRAMPQIPITEITAPDTHILQEPDNLSAYGDPIVIPSAAFGKAPSHTSVSETWIPDIQIPSRPDSSSSLAHTITKLADSISNAPFTRYRFHFISDWVRQSDMKISPVYTMPFSFHIGLVSCHFQSVFI